MLKDSEIPNLKKTPKTLLGLAARSQLHCSLVQNVQLSTKAKKVQPRLVGKLLFCASSVDKILKKFQCSGAGKAKGCCSNPVVGMNA